MHKTIKMAGRFVSRDSLPSISQEIRSLRGFGFGFRV